MGLAHLWWKHVFGHLEATILGQLEARMKMMSGGPKLCSHHRFAGPILALWAGDHIMGGLTRRHGTIHIYIYVYPEVDRRWGI